MADGEISNLKKGDGEDTFKREMDTQVFNVQILQVFLVETHFLDLIELPKNFFKCFHSFLF